MILAMNTTAGLRVGNQWLLALMVMTLSFVVLAENAKTIEWVESPPINDDYFGSGPVIVEPDKWRTLPAEETEWRTGTSEQKKSRIRFGYDAASEAMKPAQRDYGLEAGDSIPAPRTNTLFRMEF